MLRVYRVAPGDMRTQMQQEAFPDEDISDRPLPEESVLGLMVSNYSTGQIKHTRFYHLDTYLNEGDVRVVNTSRTRNAALLATRIDGTILELHLSTHLDDSLWTVELRGMDKEATSSSVLTSL